jgi:CPA2 family monovalent cation:H+ antiporter-2
MEIHLLYDIAVIFALSTIVNFVFSKIKIPTAVGYLLTGIVAGPYLLKLVTAAHEIEIMAEIGVIILLFTIGMEFSLKHLYKIRKIVFLGGLVQVLLTAGAFYLASMFYEMTWKTSLFIGFIAALSSSALVLKLLQERSELTSNYGRTVVGILIFQDLMLVPLLLFTNLLGSPEANVGTELTYLLLKTILILGIVYVGSKWVMPWLLHSVALTRNQELFMMVILLICVGVALFTSWLGMSLAFGAFLAGIMISESQYSHNAFGHLTSFKDVFTSFFFVSIGMMLDISFVIENYPIVFVSILLVLFIKTIIAGGTGFLLGHTFKGTVMVGLALSQVGEFSFILAKLGFSLEILSSYYYQLFLAVAVITMSVTPFLMKFSSVFADWMLKFPIPEFWKKGLFPLPEIQIPDMKGHIVVIGKDASAMKLSTMMRKNNIEHISVVFDPAAVKDKINNGENVIYGDAVNIPILHKAHVETAEIVVVSVGNQIAASAIIEKVRLLNPSAFVITRAPSIAHVEDLYKIGADQVLAEKLEIAIDLFNRILLRRVYPQKDINLIINEMRSLKLGTMYEKDLTNVRTIVDHLPNSNIIAIEVDKGCIAEKRTLGEIGLRTKTGATILAVKKITGEIQHPTPNIEFEEKDVLYMLGNSQQIANAETIFTGGE